MMRFTQYMAAVLLITASCGSPNNTTNGSLNKDSSAEGTMPTNQEQVRGMEQVSQETPPEGNFTYPDPWKESYKSNKVLYALSWQYERKPGQPDKLIMHDSSGYDENGKVVISKKNTVVKYSRFNDKGFVENVGFEGNGQMTQKYYFTYTPIPGTNTWQQVGYSMKTKKWDVPNNLGDTERSFPPVTLQFDSRKNLISEQGAGQDIKYTYNAKGRVVVVKDSSANALKGYKGAFESRYVFNDAGQITSYRSYVNGTMRDMAVFLKPGLPDTMKVMNPQGQIEIYRVFKYKLR